MDNPNYDLEIHDALLAFQDAVFNLARLSAIHEALPVKASDELRAAICQSVWQARAVLREKRQAVFNLVREGV